jgi:hypothetical protein
MYWAALAVALSRASMAAEPHVVVQSDGTVEVQLTVAASTEAVREILADTSGVYSTLNADIYSTESKQRGNCEEVRRETRGLFRPFKFRSLRCPSEAGFTETLLDSNDLTIYDSSWELTSTGEGTKIVYRVHTELRAAFPRPLVLQGTLAGAKETVINLALELLKRKPRE